MTKANMIKLLQEKEYKLWLEKARLENVYIKKHFPIGYGYSNALSTDFQCKDNDLRVALHEWSTVYELLEEMGIKTIDNKEASDINSDSYTYLEAKGEYTIEEVEEVEELLPEEEIKEELKLETITPTPTKKEETEENTITFEDYKKETTSLNVLKVDLASPFDKFYVLIIPSNDDENMKDFYLFCDGFGYAQYMYGMKVKNDKDAIDFAYYQGASYIDPSNYI